MNEIGAEYSTELQFCSSSGSAHLQVENSALAKSVRQPIQLIGFADDIRFS